MNPFLADHLFEKADAFSIIGSQKVFPSFERLGRMVAGAGSAVDRPPSLPLIMIGPYQEINNENQRGCDDDSLCQIGFQQRKDLQKYLKPLEILGLALIRF